MSNSTLSVTATGTASAQPDLALLQLGIEKTAPTAQNALENIRDSMQNIIAKLKAHGIAARDIQTSGLSLYQVTDTDPKTDKKTENYRAENSILIKVRDLKKLGKIFDDSVALGANMSNGLSFANTDSEPYMQKASQEAVEKAIAKAKILAQAAHVTLGPILKINADTEHAAPYRARTAMLMSSGGQGNTPIENGELTYPASVTLVFAIH